MGAGAHSKRLLEPPNGTQRQKAAEKANTNVAIERAFAGALRRNSECGTNGRWGEGLTAAACQAQILTSIEISFSVTLKSGELCQFLRPGIKREKSLTAHRACRRNVNDVIGAKSVPRRVPRRQVVELGFDFLQGQR